MYLLDTNAVIAALKGHAGILTRIKAHAPQDVAISSVVAHELYYGAFRSARTQDNLARVDALQFPVVEFDRDDARCAGEIRAGLAFAGSPIGPYDVLIAGQALSRSLILVTRNGREFSRVGELKIENWEDQS
ncbi:MAG TPA: type II toxin-antitoxin system VapC family toxin [Aquamicrobium sp.]|nr:type II toxin-antitoxin system VapC family toxin [Aquamicrobium sp.]